MSSEIIELFFFAFVAFVVINRLIAILGSENDEPVAGKKFFHGDFKDVTPGDLMPSPESNTKNFSSDAIADLIYKNSRSDLGNDIFLVSQKIVKFSPDKFLNNARKVWFVLIDSVRKDDKDMLSELVDRRFLDQFMNLVKTLFDDNYKNLNVTVKYSDVIFFGNDVIIKLHVKTDGNIQDQEWSFTKSTNDISPNWILSNVVEYIHD